MKLDDSALHRIEHVADELDNTQRRKAGNVSLKYRVDDGYWWRRVHAFGKMPYGTPERDAAWRAERDRIAVGVKDHCDECEKVVDILDEHPHESWWKYLSARMRFVSRDDGGADHINGETMLVPSVVTAEIENYKRAGKFHRSKFADDDCFEPRSTVLPLPSDTPVMPTFTGPNASYQTYLAHYWRMRYDAWKAATANPAILHVFRNYVTLHLLYMLEPLNHFAEGRRAAMAAAQPDFDGSAQLIATDIAAKFNASVFDAYAGDFAGFQSYVTLDPVTRDYLTHPGFVVGNDFPLRTNAYGVWGVTKREERFDIVDAVLGETTPRTTA